MSGAAPVPGGATSLAGRAFTITSIVIITVLLVLVLWQALEVLLLMFAAVLVAVLLRFISGALSRRTGLGEVWSLSLVLLMLLGTLVAAFWVMGPAVAVEVRALVAGMAESVDEMEELLRRNEMAAWVLDNLPDIDLGEAQQMWGRIPPALTVISQILMASVLGMLGVLLATPLLAVGIVLVRMLYVEDTLGDSLDQPVEHMPEASPPSSGG